MAYRDEVIEFKSNTSPYRKNLINLEKETLKVRFYIERYKNGLKAEDCLDNLVDVYPFAKLSLLNTNLTFNLLLKVNDKKEKYFVVWVYDDKKFKTYYSFVDILPCEDETKNILVKYYELFRNNP